MKVFKNLKIKMKIMIAFMALIIISTVSGIVNVMVMNNLASEAKITYDENIAFIPTLNELDNKLAVLRRNSVRGILETTELGTDYENILRTYKSDREIVEKLINETIINLKEAIDPVSSYKRYPLLETIEATYKDYLGCVDIIIKAVEKKDKQAAYDGLINLLPYAETMSDSVAGLMESTVNNINDNTNESISQTKRGVTVGVILMLVTIITSITIAILFGNEISKKITTLSNNAREVAKGNFNIKVATNDFDEIGILSRDIAMVVENIRNINQDIDDLASKHIKGQISANLDKDKYKGGFASIVNSVNSTVEGLIVDLKTFSSFTEKVSNGDFEAEMPNLQGEKQQFNIIANSMKNNLFEINKQIITLIDFVNKGELDYQINTSKFSGDWKVILDGLNGLMKSVEMPIKECVSVLIEVSKGEFNTEITSNYKGSFGLMKNALNDTSKTLKGYIGEIAEVLAKMSDDNLNVEIKSEYVGEFVTIKKSINTIIDKLNSVFGEFNTSADQVLFGARQMSDSSLKLAEGATEQTNSIQILNDTISTISEQIKVSAGKSKEVDTLSEVSKDNVSTGEKAMKEMLIAMERISEASENISKIIKVIDDISFQTNLLALNAAVEAARAGAHGKGFAVVAEEVRNLAARSQEAAGETNQLIENSITAVREGTRLANSTDSALSEIVSSIDKMSTLISEISHLSYEQSNSMLQVSEGIGEVSAVVLSNSAAAEESAAASEELSSQSEMLKNMINSFKLR